MEARNPEIAGLCKDCKFACIRPSKSDPNKMDMFCFRYPPAMSAGRELALTCKVWPNCGCGEFKPLRKFREEFEFIKSRYASPVDNSGDNVE